MFTESIYIKRTQESDASRLSFRKHECISLLPQFTEQHSWKISREGSDSKPYTSNKIYRLRLFQTIRTFSLYVTCSSRWVRALKKKAAGVLVVGTSTVCSHVQSEAMDLHCSLVLKTGHTARSKAFLSLYYSYIKKCLSQSVIMGVVSLGSLHVIMCCFSYYYFWCLNCRRLCSHNAPECDVVVHWGTTCGLITCRKSTPELNSS